MELNKTIAVIITELNVENCVISERRFINYTKMVDTTSHHFYDLFLRGFLVIFGLFNLPVLAG
jgi:hypothetical protein